MRCRRAAGYARSCMGLKRRILCVGRSTICSTNDSRIILDSKYEYGRHTAAGIAEGDERRDSRRFVAHPWMGVSQIVAP
jgi:hypothetical protein